MRSRAALTVLALASGIAGCDVGIAPLEGYLPDASAGTSGDAAANNCLPTDVNALLTSACQACHGAVPSGGASFSLVTASDLTAASYVDPTQSFAQRAVIRMQAMTLPMPPLPAAAASAAEIAALQAWITAGSMGVACTGGTPPTDPLNAPATCTSGNTVPAYTGGDGFIDMEPGNNCLKSGCHAAFPLSEKPFILAGTIYPTGHEPTLCSGGTSTGDVQIVITGADSTSVTLSAANGRYSPASGNFYLSRWPGTKMAPYTARVLYTGKQPRAMQAAQTDGGCNSCHTAAGDMKAPGRITLPF